MALVRWFGENDWFSQLERMQEEMDRLISFARPGRTWSGYRSNVYPPLNIYDDHESFVVWAEVPGVEPKSIDISVAGDTLTISGERTAPTVPEKASVHRRERNMGRFSRAFTLPDQVDSTKVVASCKNGILEIRLPRAEQARQRKIDVKAE